MVQSGRAQRAVRAAAVLAVAVSASAGCAGSSGTGASSEQAALGTEAIIRGDGKYDGDKSVADLLTASGEFVQAAKSVAVRVDGVAGDKANKSTTYSGVIGTSDVRVDMDRVDGGKAIALHIGNDVYLQGSEAFWRLVQGDKFTAEQAAEGASRFVLAQQDVNPAKRPPGMKSFTDYLTLTDPEVHQAYAGDIVAVSLDGKPALKVRRDEPVVQELVVDAKPPHMPLQLTGVQTRGRKSAPIRLTFSRWNEVADLARPTTGS